MCVRHVLVIREDVLLCMQMLHERIRHYKKELHEAHATNVAHEKHIARLQTEIKRLHGTFQVHAVSSNVQLVCSPPACLHDSLNVAVVMHSIEDMQVDSEASQAMAGVVLYCASHTKRVFTPWNLAWQSCTMHCQHVPHCCHLN